jgi:hypothetical protein
MNPSEPENPKAKNQAECFCGAIRRGLQEAAEMLTAPESAGDHFREARLEFLRGIRDLVDHRIDRLSRPKPGDGTRIVVE